MWYVISFIGGIMFTVVAFFIGVYFYGRHKMRQDHNWKRK